MLQSLKIIVLSATFTFHAMSIAAGEATGSPEECAYSVRQFCCPNSRRTNFEKDNVVPGVIRSDPKYIATVVYKYGTNYTYVCFGNEINSDVTLRQPWVSWPIESGPYYFTLIMYGSLLSFDHLIIGNIPENNVSAGEFISNYFPPVPPPLTGPHLYTFIVYKQRGKIAFKESPLVRQNLLFRPFFDLDKFVKKYELELYAANFFLCISNLTPGDQVTLLEE